MKTYTFDDVVNTLNQVVTYDWRGFWTERLTNHAANAPLTGLANKRLGTGVYATASELIKAWETSHKQIDALYSIGLLVGFDGAVEDTVEGMPAARAGIGPGMKVVAVNGRSFTPVVFLDALRATPSLPRLSNYWSRTTIISGPTTSTIMGEKSTPI